MDSMNLNLLSLAELKLLQKDVAKAIVTFEERKKSEAIAALEAQAREMGFSLAELTGVQPSRKRAPAQVKYRNPENPDVTWSGRGRRPLWFVEAMNAGKSPDSMSA